PLTFYIRNIKCFVISPSRKLDAKQPANCGMRAIASCKVSGFARILFTVRLCQLRLDSGLRLFKRNQFGTSLHAYTHGCKLLFQHLFFLILGQAEHKLVGSNVFFKVAKCDMPCLLTSGPDVRAFNFDAPLNGGFCKAHLVVKLQAPGMYYKSP